MKITMGVAALLAVFTISVGTATAATTITPSSTCCTFTDGPFAQDLGEIATFDNTSGSPHDVAATQNGPDGNPLFVSPALLGGQAAPVDGTQYLAAGTYPFICTIHGSSMSGELTVGGSGKAVPRPSVRVSFVAQKLRQLRKAGVKVKVKALTDSSGVTVKALKGKVVLGSKGNLNLRAGQTKAVTLRLTKAGRKAVAKGKVVKVTVKASVAFGKTVSASRRVK